MNLIQMRLARYDELLSAARRDVPADTFIHGGKILTVMTRDILKGDIAVHTGFIVSMSAKDVQAKQTVAANGTGTVFADPGETGGPEPGDLDLSGYLHKYRDSEITHHRRDGITGVFVDLGIPKHAVEKGRAEKCLECAQNPRRRMHVLLDRYWA
jgi:hypothetical protein